MFSLRLGYIVSAIITGFILLYYFLITLPDGKLHIYHCSVGQGDATYVRFPSGQDMLIDGGPTNAVLGCLSRHMPFWDRTLDGIMMTHPQSDHFYGLIEVLKRYTVKVFITSEIANITKEYKSLVSTIQNRKVPVRYVSSDDRIEVSSVLLTFLWPTEAQITHGKQMLASNELLTHTSSVMGASSEDYNDYSLVFLLSYGGFQALFTGDADTRVESGYRGTPLPDDHLELLKVPHHGSKTGMSQTYTDWLFGGTNRSNNPSLAIISVGKNLYGHPSVEALQLLAEYGVSVYRTDNQGDIEVVSDGQVWQVKTHKLRR